MGDDDGDPRSQGGEAARGGPATLPVAGADGSPGLVRPQLRQGVKGLQYVNSALETPAFHFLESETSRQRWNLAQFLVDIRNWLPGPSRQVTLVVKSSPVRDMRDA